MNTTYLHTAPADMTNALPSTAIACESAEVKISGRVLSNQFNYFNKL